MVYFKLAFPTGRDSETFRDNGTEIPSLSRDKGTTGQAENLAREKGVCPGTFAPALVPGQRDAGTRIFFVPGQRDNGTSRPGLSRDVPRDVPSLGNPSGNCISGGISVLISVRSWNFKDGGSLKASFLAKNQHATKEKPLKKSYE